MRENKNIKQNNENIPNNQDSIYAILKDMYSAEYLVSQIRYIAPYDSMSDKDLSHYIYSAVMKKHNINDSQCKCHSYPVISAKGGSISGYHSVLKH